MKARKMLLLAAAVLCGGTLFNAAAQIYLDGSLIQFRTLSTYDKTTNHYGDLTLFGANGNGGWGWITGNRLIINSQSSNNQTSAINTALTI